MVVGATGDDEVGAGMNAGMNRGGQFEGYPAPPNPHQPIPQPQAQSTAQPVDQSMAQAAAGTGELQLRLPIGDFTLFRRQVMVVIDGYRVRSRNGMNVYILPVGWHRVLLQQSFVASKPPQIDVYIHPGQTSTLYFYGPYNSFFSAKIGTTPPTLAMSIRPIAIYVGIVLAALSPLILMLILFRLVFGS